MVASVPLDCGVATIHAFRELNRVAVESSSELLAGEHLSLRFASGCAVTLNRSDAVAELGAPGASQESGGCKRIRAAAHPASGRAAGMESGSHEALDSDTCAGTDAGLAPR